VRSSALGPLRGRPHPAATKPPGCSAAALAPKPVALRPPTSPARRLRAQHRRTGPPVLPLLQPLDDAYADRSGQEFAGRSGSGDWADCLLELDADFGRLLDLIDQLDITEETIVIFAGDNGAEETLPWRGTSGVWEGSYFTGMEGSLRTPCLIRWPGHVPDVRRSNEIVHITDMFTTLVRWAGA
jgi:arylsulfatase A-like enzyme